MFNLCSEMDSLSLALAIFNLSSSLVNNQSSVCFSPEIVDTTLCPDTMREAHYQSFVHQNNVRSLSCPLSLCTPHNTVYTPHCKPIVDKSHVQGYRGNRAGKRKQRRIPTIVNNNRHPLNPQHTHSANLNNLINCTQMVQGGRDSDLKFLYMNAQSCRNKCLEIFDLILESEADLIFITETWFKPGDDVLINEMLPPDFKICSVPRSTGTGGGTAIVYRSCLSVTDCKGMGDFVSFEHCSIHVRSSTSSAMCICVYRPPPSKKNRHTTNAFVSEFSNFLDSVSSEQNVFILGDFNLHFENVSDSIVKSFSSLLDEHSLDQLVHQPTHRKNHMLDLVLVRSQYEILSDVSVVDKCLSDHFVLSFRIDFQRSRLAKQLVKSRNIKDIDPSTFKESLCTSLAEHSPCTFEAFDNVLKNALDSFAPVKEKYINPSRRPAPWLNARVKIAKQERRKAERQWKKSGLEVHKQIYKSHKINVVKVIREEKKNFYNNKITESESTNELYKICNELTGTSKCKPHPTNVPFAELPTVLNNFFVNKIENIRTALDQSPSVPEFHAFNGKSLLVKFEPVSEKYVRSLIGKSPKKFCSLDPLPAQLFHECIDVLLPYITSLINSSLANGIVPDCYKFAIVHPLLKKSGLDQNVLKNYRPVSNLPFFSKILEKVVLSQIDAHLVGNSLKEVYQSAYKAKHSTETALLKVKTDLLNATDDGNVSVLALLDLSAAFDTLDHSILLERLNVTFGIRGTVLKWLESYLYQRSQSVIVGQELSPPSTLRFGVPQGSVLGPVLFSLYA